MESSRKIALRNVKRHAIRCYAAPGIVCFEADAWTSFACVTWSEPANEIVILLRAPRTRRSCVIADGRMVLKHENLIIAQMLSHTDGMRAKLMEAGEKT